MTSQAERPVLALDAAPGTGSVALVRGRSVLAARAVAMRGAVRAQGDDDDPLMVAVDGLLRDFDTGVSDLAGVACGAGPGGFTSLRIAASIAKGLAHAAGRPLLAGPSLAWAAAVRAPAPGTWLVTLDALRGEHYAAAVTLDTSRHVAAYAYLGVHSPAAIDALMGEHRATAVLAIEADPAHAPIAAGVVALPPVPVDLAAWAPSYGRLAEAQARWEAVHGPLAPGASPGTPSARAPLDTALRA